MLLGPTEKKTKYVCSLQLNAWKGASMNDHQSNTTWNMEPYIPKSWRDPVTWLELIPRFMNSRDHDYTLWFLVGQWIPNLSYLNLLLQEISTGWWSVPGLATKLRLWWKSRPASSCNSFQFCWFKHAKIYFFIHGHLHPPPLHPPSPPLQLQ